MEIKDINKQSCRIIACVSSMILQENKYIQSYKRTALYNYDQMQEDRVALILYSIRHHIIKVGSHEFLSHLYACYHNLIKDDTEKQFCDNIRASYKSICDINLTFEFKINNLFTKARGVDDIEYGIEQYNTAMDKCLIYLLYDFEDFEEDNALYGLTSEQLRDLMYIIQCTIHKFFPYY